MANRLYDIRKCAHIYYMTIFLANTKWYKTSYAKYTSLHITYVESWGYVLDQSPPSPPPKPPVYIPVTVMLIRYYVTQSLMNLIIKFSNSFFFHSLAIFYVKYFVLYWYSILYWFQLRMTFPYVCSRCFIYIYISSLSPALIGYSFIPLLTNIRFLTL